MRGALLLLLIVMALGGLWLLRPERAPERSDHAPEVAPPQAAPPPAAAAASGAEAAAGLQRSSAPPAEAAVESESAVHEIRGRIEVVGSSWTEPIELTTWSTDASGRGTLVLVECGADGSFRHVLSAPEAVAVFRLPDAFRILETEDSRAIEDDSFRVDGTRHGVRVRAEVLPHALLLLRTAADGKPVPRTGIQLLIFRGERDSSMLGLRTDARGLARLTRRSLEGVTRLDAFVTLPQTGSECRRALDPERLRADPGPHEILLEAGPWIEFVVRDPLGAAVPGARAMIGSASWEPTGADGRGRYRDSDPHAERVVFAAPRHRRTAVLVPHPPPALLEVTMPRASTLTVQLSDWHPAVAQSYRVEVKYRRAGAASALPPEQHEFGRVAHGQHFVTRRGNARSEFAAEAVLTFADDGIVMLDGIFTDLPAELTLHLAGIPLHRETVGFRLDGVERTVTASGLFEPRSARGSAVDEAGLPVAGAQVTFGSPEGARVYAMTDAAGRFEFGPLPQGAPIPILAEAAGHLPARHLWPPDVDGAEEIVLTLPRARAVELRVLRADGRPFTAEDGGRSEPSEWPSAELPDGTLLRPDASGADGAPLPPHAWRFDGLPPGFVTFRMSAAAGSAELLHDTAEDVATLILRIP